MAAPFFSICTPVYNGEPFVAAMIDSMLGQKFADWEWILVNDGSTDRGWEIVRQRLAGDCRVRLLENAGNRGQRESLNRLLEEARGEWVGVLPADDAYRAHTLQTVAEHVRNREDLFLWAHSRLAVGEGKIPDVILIRKEVTEWSGAALAEELFLRGNLFGGMANYFFRRSAAAEAKLTFLGNDARVDIYFWIRLLKSQPARRAVYHPDVLSVVMEHSASLSVSCGRSGEAAANIFELPRDLLPLGWSRGARLRQLARLGKSWLRFFPDLPAGRRAMPGRVMLAYLGSLLRADA